MSRDSECPCGMFLPHVYERECIAELLTQLANAESRLTAERAIVAALCTNAGNLEAERDRFRERLDQFETYDITVASALADRERLAATAPGGEGVREAPRPSAGGAVVSGDLADARAKAEEALAEAMTCLAGWGAEAILDVEKQLARQLGMLAAALRALLDALPQPPPPRPAQDAVREAAERLRWQLTPPRTTTPDGWIFLRAEDVDVVLLALADAKGPK